VAAGKAVDGGQDSSPGSASAFALWLNSRFTGQDDFEKKLENVVKEINDKIQSIFIILLVLEY